LTEFYHPPIKRSVEIAGHKTSISLEPLFWDWLRQVADDEGLPINALVARIDAERIAAPVPPGLAGAIRVWLVVNRERSRASGGQGPGVRRP
jgi:predicted DNA-binding ribbon-helix-helix protein